MADTLWTVLARRAEGDDGSALITTPDGPIQADQLADRARRVAGGLAALGVEPGSRVAVLADNRAEHFDLAFAANVLRASYAPVNPQYRGHLVDNALRTLSPTVGVVDAACRDAVEPYAGMIDRWVALDPAAADGLPGEVVLWDDVAASQPAGVADSRERSEAMVLFTSGTTGPSKGIGMADGFLLEVARANADAREVRAEDRLHSAFAFCHANPIGYTLLPALVSGAGMAWQPAFSASNFWRDLTALEATQFSAFSAVFLMLLAQAEGPEDRQHPARICFGVGSPRQRVAEFEERFGVRVIEGYGLSECGAITYQDRNARRLGSIGKATPGWEVAVVDDDDQPVTTGEAGEIVGRPVRPGLLMEGYIGRPEATLEAYRNLWFHTGDRGYVDDDGFLWFLDRKKDAIRRRGENISSFDVEEAVLATGAVVECAAFPVPSPLGEDEVMLAVVPVAQPFDEDALLRDLARLLPAYALPTYVRVVEELPRTPTGKVQKYRLRDVGVTDDTWQRPESPRRPLAPSGT